MVLQSIKLERFKAIFIKINWSDTLIKRLRHIASKSTQLNCWVRTRVLIWEKKKV